MAQQTAVDWLIEQLKSRYDIHIERLSVTDKAKEMEKQEKEKCWIAALEYGLKVLKTDENATSKEAFEQYYNETYGK